MQLEYNNDYIPYLWVKNFLNSTEVEKILQIRNNVNMEQGKIGDKNIYADNIRKSKIHFIDQKNHTWIYEKLTKFCVMINMYKYKFEIIGFENKLQLTEYNKDDFYHWHTDVGKNNASRRKLSITIQLSDSSEYSGGELQFLDANNYINAPKNKGTAIVFPAYTAHRVQPVLTGTRRSIVGWVSGPPYR